MEATPDKRNGEVIFSYKPRKDAEQMIYKLISDITISMKSCDYLKLPECVINEVPAIMDEKEKEIYSSFVRIWLQRSVVKRLML